MGENCCIHSLHDYSCCDWWISNRISLVFIIDLQFDYKHSEADVNAGYAVGAICTLLAYYLIYGKTISRYSTDGEEHSSSSKSSVQLFVCFIVISLHYIYLKGVDESNRGRMHSSSINLE